MEHKKFGLAVVLAFPLLLLVPGNAAATLDQAKLYQKVFGGDKPKCIVCHTDKLPKKGDGKHDPNEYGKTLRAVQEIPDKETYMKVGKAPETKE